MPLKAVWLERMQSTLAIPLILTFGMAIAAGFGLKR